MRAAVKGGSEFWCDGVQVTDMAWPDSEEIERGVMEAGGDQEEAFGLKLIHKFNNAILMGDPAGGVFIAVDKDDMRATTKAVGVSNDDQVPRSNTLHIMRTFMHHSLLPAFQSCDPLNWPA